MAKPELSSISQILPVFVQSYEHYLPTAFDGNMTMLQKVNKVIKAIQDVYVVSNELIVKWNEVVEWVIGEGLNAQIAERLDAMVADGTFASIINQELLAEKPNIFVGTIAPTNPTTNTFWYKDMGNAPEIKPYVTTEITFDEEV